MTSEDKPETFGEPSDVAIVASRHTTFEDFRCFCWRSESFKCFWQLPSFFSQHPPGKILHTRPRYGFSVIKWLGSKARKTIRPCSAEPKSPPSVPKTLSTQWWSKALRKLPIYTTSAAGSDFSVTLDNQGYCLQYGITVDCDILRPTGKMISRGIKTLLSLRQLPTTSQWEFCWGKQRTATHLWTTINEM